MAEQLQITVNGVDRGVDPGCTLGDLVTELELNRVTVVAMRNDEVVERDHFDAVTLEAGDVLELVAFVRGG